MRKLTGFNEGGTERDDLVVLVEGNICHSIREGDTILRTQISVCIFADTR